MSKIGNHRVATQESADYRFGWESAERGEPEPDWTPVTVDEQGRKWAQQMGWTDFHNSEQQP